MHLHMHLVLLLHQYTFIAFECVLLRIV